MKKSQNKSELEPPKCEEKRGGKKGGGGKSAEFNVPTMEIGKQMSDGSQRQDKGVLVGGRGL